MKKGFTIYEKIIKGLTFYAVFSVVFLLLIALFGTPGNTDAYVGSFETTSLNSGWTLSWDNTEREIELPYDIRERYDGIVSLKNTLPLDVKNGMELRTRESLQDIYIYIDGELRGEYSSEHLAYNTNYPPSAFLLVDLTEEDAGAPIEIRLNVKGRRSLSEVEYGYGNNVWFKTIYATMPIVSISIVVVVIGVVVLICYGLFSRKIRQTRAIMYLSLTMIDTGIWMFSESLIRQLILQRPQIAAVFSFMAVELIGALAGMFFDEVQHREHHIAYIGIESVAIFQLFINTGLHMFNIVEFHHTLIFSHVWAVSGIAFVVYTIIKDFKSGRIKEYAITAIGMAAFAVTSLMELFFYYISNSHILGIFIGSGLVLLMAFAIGQIVYDEIRRIKLQEKHRQEMTNNMMETISSAIDAKDEYTGGHSYRVGEYAKMFATGIANDYGFSEEDLIRIQYIGTLHDIGKIGVSDLILNKAGKLTEEEYELMKKHTLIGHELLNGMNEVEGLLDGIRYHHERYDGMGYPDGLKGTEIPLIGRILCLADSYDAMTSNRVYRDRLSDSEVRSTIIECSGTQFDPDLTKRFIELLDEGKISPITRGGLDTDKKGNLLKSSMLEGVLQKNLLNPQNTIKNPSYVRMICYLIKLKEKQGGKVDMFFFEIKSCSGNELALWQKQIYMGKLCKSVRGIISTHEATLEYTDSKIIAVFFDRTDSDIKELVRRIKADVDGDYEIVAKDIAKREYI